jgi:hypothetical protein
MLIRSLAAAAFTAALFACTSPTSSVAGSTNSAQTNGNTADKSNSSSSGSAGSASATDGTWDITADGLKPSSITFSGSKITGSIVFDDQYDSDGDGTLCTASHTMTFSLSVSGNKLTGTNKDSIAYDSGCGADHAPTSSSTSNISADRGKTPAADAKTFLEGDWQVTVDDNDPLSISVAGLVLKMFSNENGAANSDDPVTLTINGGKASATGSDMTFAAKRR